MNYFIILGVLISVLTAGCAETRYVPYREGDGETTPFTRKVGFEITREFYVDIPDCVVVLPAVPQGGQQHYDQLVEQDLSRQLRGKISRVIDPIQRRITTRELALPADLGNPADRLLLAGELDCDAVVFFEVKGGQTSLLFWSKFSIVVDVRMEKVSNGKTIWQARTEATRSDGGLPLGPFSIFANAFNSARFVADEADVGASVISDAVRRLIQTLPDARSFGAAKLRM